MISVVCFKWRPHKGARSRFAGWHVNRLRAMFAKHLHMPHRFICVTDDESGIESEVETVELWDDLSSVPNPHGAREPSCYRRLKLFARDAGETFGERILWCDLDMMLTGDVTPLFDRPEDVVLLGTDSAHIPVNGSLVMLTAGSHPEVWEDFDPEVSPGEAHRAGHWGSDQGWLGYKLPDAAKWTENDGILFFWRYMQQHPRGRLPDGTKLVSFHGRGQPWDAGPQEHDWVREHYGEPETCEQAA